MHHGIELKTFLLEQLQKQRKKTDQPFIQVRTVIDQQNLLEWLNSQNDPVQFYWSDRERKVEIAGIGQTDCLTSIQPLQPETRYFGGLCFNSNSKNTDPDWTEFGPARFILPRFELQNNGPSTLLTWNIALKNLRRFDPHKELSALDTLFINHSNSTLCSEIIHPKDTLSKKTLQENPVFSEWQTMIQSALNGLKLNKFKKIVLARKNILTFEQNIHAIHLLKQIQESSPDCFHFLFQPAPEIAFIGASPERLYKRNQTEIWTEALAGTRFTGKTSEEEKKTGEELLHSQKDQLEHGFVVHSLEKTLQTLCTSFQKPDFPALLSLPKIQHLYTPFYGAIKKDMTDFQILTHLHPTPAVGGLPKNSTLAEITELEPFDRGWYAGPIGWISQNQAEFAVAIRSALVVGPKVHVFGGAGIVEGSTAASEWLETENKMNQFMEILFHHAVN